MKDKTIEEKVREIIGDGKDIDWNEYARLYKTAIGPYNQLAHEILDTVAEKLIEKKVLICGQGGYVINVNGVSKYFVESRNIPGTLTFTYPADAVALAEALKLEKYNIRKADKY